MTSNPDRHPEPDDDALIISGSMRCAGYPDGLQALPDAGYFRSANDLLWETPFGNDDHPDKRMYQVRSPDGGTIRSLMDASYLVEPFDGVWMLMIDANVFVPRNGAGGDGEEDFADSTDAGWNAMLRHKRFVLGWIKTVSERADRFGKTLIAFSHYPALDPLDGTAGDELALLGRTSLLGRIPETDVGAALIDAGIRVHFSGHLHINDTARLTNDHGFLVNVSVPSLVAFPAAYKIIRIEVGRLAIETVDIGGMPLDGGIMAVYRAEASRAGIDARALLTAENYGEFLSQHLGHLVGRRYLKREWPDALALAIRQLTLCDLAVLACLKHPVALSDLPAALRVAHENAAAASRLAALDADMPALMQITGMVFLGDWYRVRMGSDLGIDTIGPANLLAYRFLARLYDGLEMQEGSAQSAFRRLFGMFDRFISGLPSRNFSIDLATGDIEAK